MQQGICADFAHESGWRSVLRAFADDGESSETLERPALQQLLKKIETGQIDRVVVYAMDRLTRRLFDLHRLLEVFDRHDVTLHVVLDPHFGRSPEGRLITNIVAEASEFQQDLTRERMTDARDSLKQQGRRVAGRVPDGYVVDRKSKQLMVDRVAAQCVRAIFELAAAGTVPTEIAQIANQRGRRTRKGKNGGLWTSRQILKLLFNPTWAGRIRNGQGTLPGQHEAVVEEYLFEAVRQAIASRSHVGHGRRGRYTWPLRGLLKCGRCGRLMNSKISQKGPIRYRYCRCRSTAGGKPSCRSVGISAYEMERFVRLMISSVSSDDPAEIHAEAGSFSALWKQLDERSQMLSMPKIVREALFDPDAGIIEVILFDDAAARLGTSPQTQVFRNVRPRLQIFFTGKPGVFQGDVDFGALMKCL